MQAILVKSPSDTTIYVPALSKRIENVNIKENELLIAGYSHNIEPELVNKISNFADAARRESDKEMEKTSTTPPKRRSSVVVVPGREEVEKRSEQAILEAEKFKASIIPPTGMNTVDFVTKSSQSLGYGNDLLNTLNCVEMQPPPQPSVQMIQTQKFPGNGNLVRSGPGSSTDSMSTSIGVGSSDDDFFHLICHIDSNLKEKIENGEYVDLDKLLPKDKHYHFAGNYSDDERLEWVQTQGGTFLVPAKKQTRINSFRKWEQAFRIFATIYCGKHPNRACEIWQYISVINTAASSFAWDNVYHYDMTFRQLMQFNPNRSWAIT